MKKIFDFLMSLIAIIILSPVILIVALAVKFTSPGPILFKQRRIGKDNVEFEIYKFRTMRIDTPNVPTHLLENPEQWITPVGKFLRKTSLDELPQILNIIKGDLSIIGPRPVIKDELEKYGMNKAKFLSVTPGLTGFWAANGRSDTTYEQRMLMELYYVDHISWELDVKVFLKTIISVIKREGAI